MATVTGETLIKGALLEIGRIAAGETVGSDLSTFCLDRLNRIVDNWNVEKETVLAETFNSFTFTPNLNPHTIGPTGTFVVASRPVTIESASVIDSTVSPAVHVPINLVDYQWWDAQSVPALATSWPTNLYYQPTWPNGTLNFWPVPTTAYGVELVYRAILSAFALSTSVSLAPGYADAYMYSLAEDVATTFGVTDYSSTADKARKARNRVFKVNAFTPSIRTQDSGMPSSGGGQRSDFNWMTGLRIS